MKKFLLILILFCHDCFAHEMPEVKLLSYRYQRIQQSAQEFIYSLTSEQRMRLLQPYNSPFRTRGFCYVLVTCRDFTGLLLYDLNAEQKLKLNKLFLSLLSTMGYRNILGIMERQELLNEMEATQRKYPLFLQLAGPTQEDLEAGAPAIWTPPPGRSHLEYSIVFYGDIHSNQWALRFEGHHLSLNFTFLQDNNGNVTISPWPLFMGASPMIVPKRPDIVAEHLPFWTLQEGSSLLWRQVIMAREVVMAMTPLQRQNSDWGKGAPAALYGSAKSPVTHEILNINSKLFIPASQLSDLAQYLLKEYIKEYFNVFNTEIEGEFNIDEIVKQARISWWSQNLNSDFSSFYLRVVSGNYLIELSQMSGYSIKFPGFNAIHIHSAVRNVKEDWDSDVIDAHEHYHHDHDH